MQCGLWRFPYCSLALLTVPVSVRFSSDSMERASAIKPAIVFFNLASTIRNSSAKNASAFAFSSKLTA